MEDQASRLASLISDLRRVHGAMRRVDHECSAYLAAITVAQRSSARNLLHYLALRSYDLRSLQPVLASIGVSSLGRTESHVRYGLEAVLGVLHQLGGLSWTDVADEPPLTKDAGEVLLADHTDALFGPAPDGRTVRIMVTMPGEASTDARLVRDLVDAGMDCMRVNCAHDDESAWGVMIDHLRRANADSGRHCRVLMDIAGPKLRTSALPPGPPVIKVRPSRNTLGQVVRPATVVLSAATRPRPPQTAADAVLRLDGVPPPMRPGSEVTCIDARGRTRRLRVRASEDDVIVAELDRTAYLLSGTGLRFEAGERVVERRVVDVPAMPNSVLVREGETLLLIPESEPGHPAIRDGRDRVVVPASIGITLPEVFRDARPEESVWFDDGRIGGEIRRVTPDQIEVAITHARPLGSRLGSGKGVNLPDTDLRVSPLTPKDQLDLSFVARHADLVGYSFVHHPDDVHQLRRCLADLQAQQLGLILKIETRQAFERLPKLLLAAMQGGPFGVMIARGDLAVECGYERLAEVQEEILWICEAAHTPVIWATQVLETLAKTGIPSRAEVTDAAMSERAECVMLNKGPYIGEAVRTLDDILRRMQAHQTKKRAMLRPLHVAHDILADLTEPAPVSAD
jgi:pyruvate kinase